MSLIIDLPRPLAMRLQIEATEVGLLASEYAAELIIKSLPYDKDAEEELKRLHTLRREFEARIQSPTVES